MRLTVLDATDASLRAGYSCPCGCAPSVEYGRGAALAEEGCCCGNRFAVGPQAAASLPAKDGFHSELESFAAPWGERLEAAWLVGPSVHGPASEHEHRHDDDHAHDHARAELPMAGGGAALDPVCGMTITPTQASARGLASSYDGVDYFFCGKGCKLEFDEDPAHYLDPAYTPSM